MLARASLARLFARLRAESAARLPDGVRRAMLALVSTMMARASRSSIAARRLARSNIGCASAATATARMAARVARSKRS
jgi:hypothetical protein